MNQIKSYNDFIPPCGIFCGACPRFLREKNPCPGAAIHCQKRKCKGIHVCSEKRGHRFCYECDRFPCSRFRQFAASWQQYDQDLIANQEQLRALGEAAWLDQWNNSGDREP
jgi:hypothetical protein